MVTLQSRKPADWSRLKSSRSGAAGNHRGYAASEPGTPDHRHMNHQECDQPHRDEKMKRAGGLMASQHRDGGRYRGDESRRHCEAGPDDERGQDEYDREIGETL